MARPPQSPRGPKKRVSVYFSPEQIEWLSARHKRLAIAATLAVDQARMAQFHAVAMRRTMEKIHALIKSGHLDDAITLTEETLNGGAET